MSSLFISLIKTSSGENLVRISKSTAPPPTNGSQYFSIFAGYFSFSSLSNRLFPPAHFIKGFAECMIFFTAFSAKFLQFRLRRKAGILSGYAITFTSVALPLPFENPVFLGISTTLKFTFVPLSSLSALNAGFISPM